MNSLIPFSTKHWGKVTSLHSELSPSGAKIGTISWNAEIDISLLNLATDTMGKQRLGIKGSPRLNLLPIP